MVISHRKKYLYFVVPKSASATIRQSLREHTDIGYPVTEYPQHLPIHRFLATEHAHLMDDYFKFTFVRNPYDRLYSGYVQDRYASETYGRWIEAKKPIFEQIGDDFNRYVEEYVSAGDIENDWRWICFCPMIKFSHYENQYCLDWFGRAENLEEDLGTLAMKGNLKITKSENENVRVAPSKQLKYLNKYKSSTVALVNRLYKEDFEFFGYTPLDPNDFPTSIARTS